MHTQNTFFLRNTLVILAFLILLSPFYSAAQSSDRPTLITSWRTDSYVPPGYHGKALPVAGVNIEVGIMVVDGGSVVDLSGQEVQWVVNEELLAGVGFETIRFRADGRQRQRIRVTIPNYALSNGTSQNLFTFFDIPLAEPELVLRPLGRSADQKTFRFEAIPFFFGITNLDQLVLRWRANGRTIEDVASQVGVLELSAEDLPAGTRISLDVTAQNISNDLELVQKSLKIVAE